MKNALIIVLGWFVIVLCAAQQPQPVTSISFDGGKTKLVGDVTVQFTFVDADHKVHFVRPQVSTDKDGKTYVGVNIVANEY